MRRQSMRQKRRQSREDARRRRAEMLHVCLPLLVACRMNDKVRRQRRKPVRMVLFARRQLVDAKQRSLLVKFESLFVCFSTAAKEAKSRCVVRFTQAGTRLRSAASRVHNVLMPLSIWDPAKGIEGVSSPRCTPLNCSTACVEGRMLLSSGLGVSGGVIFLLATAAARPCANSRQMHPSPAFPPMVPFQLPVFFT